MYRRNLAFIVVLTLALAGASFAREVQDYSSTINNFKQSSDVAPFFDSAYGYAVFPTIGKGGLGIGASTRQGPGLCRWESDRLHILERCLHRFPGWRPGL